LEEKDYCVLLFERVPYYDLLLTLYLLENLLMGTLMPTNRGEILPVPELPGYTNPPFHSSSQLDIRQIFRALLNRKWMILIITLGVFAAVALYSFLIPSTYLSTVAIQIDPEAVKVLPYSAISDSMVKAPADFELYMKTQDEILRSPSLIACVIKKTQEKYKTAQLAILRGGFESGMSIFRIQGSQIVRISYESYDPDFSALVANTVAEEFIKLHFESKVDTTRKAGEFLQNQLRALKQRVEKAEEDMIRYAGKHNILELGSNQENVVRQRLSQLNSQVTEVERELGFRRAANEEMQKVTPANFLSRLRTPEIANLETEVNKAAQELSSLRTQFGENWPQLVRKKNDFAVLQQQLLELKRDILAEAKRDAEAHYVAALNQHQMLSKTLRDQQQLVNQLNEASIQYNTLKRDVDAGELLYQGLLQRVKETGISAALEFGNIHVTDPATPSRIPYQPRIFWNLSLGLLLGFSAGIALAFFIEYFDTSLKGFSDMESMGIPMLGWVPIFEREKVKKLALNGTPSSIGSLLQSSPVSAPSSIVPASTIVTWDVQERESYRSIIASLLLSRPANPAKTILITSSIPKEGKTTTVINLGMILAETGAKILLIDSDFRNSSLTNRFGLSNRRGLSIHLAGGEINICKTHLLNLFILPAGPLPPNPVSLFASSGFSETLTMLKETFQFILIDSAPMLSVADASVVSAKVDGVILVVRAGETPREIISRTHLQLLRSGASVLGAAVTHVNLKNSEYHYYRKYYYESKYVQETGPDGPTVTS
jgi:polysaccharide biosynthesis transport protein